MGINKNDLINILNFLSIGQLSGRKLH